MDKTETINILRRQIGVSTALNSKYKHLLFYYSNRLNCYEIQNIEQYIHDNNTIIIKAKTQIRYLNILLDTLSKDTYKQLKLNI